METVGVAAGSQFGQYRLLRLLGAGGFGEVYAAEDTVMGRQVALKLIAAPYSHDPVFRQRLFREARTAGRLTEPHIVPVHGYGEIDGRLYIDMRLISGTDLATILARSGPMDAARAVAIVSQIAAALDAAHAAEMLHRDIKPSNILLGDDDFACLVDFGLANAATDTKLTNTGTTIGSFGYLAPERLTHNAAIGRESDIYSLACVLYECLTGSAPYPGSDLPALISAHLTAPIPRPSQQQVNVPSGFDDVIARGMAKDPAQRYRSAGDLAGAAQQALATADHHYPSPVYAFAPTQDALAAFSPGGAESPRRPRPGRTGIVIAVLITAGAAIAGVLGGIGFTRRSAPASTLALVCDQARQAATSYATILTTSDYRTIDKNFAEVLAGSTGEFKDSYSNTSRQSRQQLVDNQAVAQGVVIDSAVQSCSADRVVVLMFIDQHMTNAANPRPKINSSRVKMTMEHVGDSWLASKVEVL